MSSVMPSFFMPVVLLTLVACSSPPPIRTATTVNLVRFMCCSSLSQVRQWVCTSTLSTTRASLSITTSSRWELPFGQPATRPC